MATLRPDIPVPTGWLATLPIADNGYPVPWFVPWIDGKPEFRVADSGKVKPAVRDNLCWVCGNKLGRFRAFVSGPMSAVNSISAEPPSHRECAEYSVKACPFLTKPHMVRRPDENGNHIGVPLPGQQEHNPGVSLIWVTDKPYSYYQSLFFMPEPSVVEWWARGRFATSEEIMSAMLMAKDKVAALGPSEEELAGWWNKAEAFMKRWPACVSKNNSSPTSESGSTMPGVRSG